MSQIVKERIEQIRQGIVPEGYKITDIGIIPENWFVKSLGEISKVYGGEMIASSKLGDDGYPYLHYADLHSLKQSFIDIEVNKSEFPKLKKSLNAVKNGCLLEHGDVVFCDASEDYEGIGKHVLIKNTNNIPFIAGLHTMIAKFNDNTLVDSYKKFIFSNHNVRKEFMFYATGISVLGITLDNIKKVLLPIPTENEQQKISEVLSTWDQTIELKESLIREKTEEKNELMEKLLNPNENWENIRLGDVLKNKVKRGFSDLELIAVTMRDGVIKRSELDRKDTSSANKENYKLVEPNDIVYNTMRMWQGVSGISRYRGIVSPAYTVLEPKLNKVDPLFISYLFKLDSVINIFRRYSQGLVKDTLNLKYSNFKNIRLKFPSLDKQNLYAKILNTKDKELKLLKQEVKFLKE